MFTRCQMSYYTWPWRDKIPFLMKISPLHYVSVTESGVEGDSEKF